MGDTPKIATRHVPITKYAVFAVHYVAFYLLLLPHVAFVKGDLREDPQVLIGIA